MEVRHTLSACDPLIDADVVAIGLVQFVEQRLALVDGAQQGVLFNFRGVEQGWEMAFGDDYSVAGRNRKTIFVNHREFVFGKDARGIKRAEWAGFGGHGV